MSNIEFSYLHIPTIPREFISQMVDHLETETCLNDDLRDQLTGVLSRKKISIFEYVSFFRALAKYLDDEMLGFLPRKVPLGSFAALCQMLYHSPDIVTALENYNRFYSLFLSPGDTLLDISGLSDGRRITINSLSELSGQPMFQQTLIMTLLRIPAWLSGRKVSLDLLQFSFETMPFDEEFSYLYGVIPQFESDTTSLLYSKSVLDYPIQPSESAEDFGDHYIEHLLLWSSKDDFARNVYAEISRGLPNGQYDVVMIAKEMGVSKHTLARRLKTMGSSYSEILVRVRKDKALYLLLNSSESVDSIAETLGFKELGSFSRAFKSWTNLSPSQYREQGSDATIR